MDYLQLVNSVIDESAMELNHLTYDTWDSAEAGRRMYPRIKRYVREAWKTIQMERNQWEFNNTEGYAVVYPRFKFENGSGTTLPTVGTVFVGADSGFTFTVRELFLDEGTWTDSVASGQIEFDVHDGDTRINRGEVFNELGGDGMFTYLERGSYDFGLRFEDLNEINFTTFVMNTFKHTPIPGRYVPWANWLYQSFEYSSGGVQLPTFFSQDPEGKIVFLQQSFEPFTVSFIYAKNPQMLTEPTDVPTGLRSMYHEWIVWEAVMLLATYDKNSSLFAHASKQATFYRRVANGNLTPNLSWRSSSFNE